MKADKFQLDKVDRALLEFHRSHTPWVKGRGCNTLRGPAAVNGDETRKAPLFTSENGKARGVG